MVDPSTDRQDHGSPAKFNTAIFISTFHHRHRPSIAAVVAVVLLTTNTTNNRLVVHPYSLYKPMDFSSEPGPKMGCVIRGYAPATSLSYHESGSHLFVASEVDSTLRIVDCINGGAPTDRSPMIKLQREGIRTVKATHHGHCVLFSPGMNDGVPKKNSVYYLSVHDNKILREFEGHSGVINGLSMSPVDDTFLSSSVDGTVR
jgi:WD40 repeat protein